MAKESSGAVVETQQPQSALTSSRREERTNAMRSRLLDAAESIFATEGQSGLTNRHISAEAGTTTQAIYTYFGSREALLDAMYRRAIDGAEEIIGLASSSARTDPDERDVFDAFCEAAREYRRFCLGHPGRFRLIRSGPDAVGLPTAATALRSRLVDAISSFGRSGPGKQTPLYEARVHMTVSAMHGFFQAELDGFIDESLNPEALFDELVHRCLISYDLLVDL